MNSFTFIVAGKDNSIIDVDFTAACIQGLGEEKKKSCSLFSPLQNAPQILLDFENFEHINITAISHNHNFLTSLIGPIHWVEFNKQENTNEQSVQRFQQLAHQNQRLSSLMDASLMGMRSSLPARSR